jgi:hypothetical protein
MSAITTAHPDRGNPNPVTRVRGKKVTSVKQCMRYESCPRRNYVPKFMADFYGMIQRIPEISLS